MKVLIDDSNPCKRAVLSSDKKKILGWETIITKFRKNIFSGFKVLDVDVRGDAEKVKIPEIKKLPPIYFQICYRNKNPRSKRQKGRFEIVG
tara:strand:+ start:303 stop:575 length:273 start_codon:yes stop_codon:yes gene_type:complete